jgi:hypothetical protein
VPLAVPVAHSSGWHAPAQISRSRCCAPLPFSPASQYPPLSPLPLPLPLPVALVAPAVMAVSTQHALPGASHRIICVAVPSAVQYCTCVLTVQYICLQSAARFSSPHGVSTFVFAFGALISALQKRPRLGSGRRVRAVPRGFLLRERLAQFVRLCAGSEYVSIFQIFSLPCRRCFHGSVILTKCSGGDSFDTTGPRHLYRTAVGTLP